MKKFKTNKVLNLVLSILLSLFYLPFSNVGAVVPPGTITNVSVTRISDSTASITFTMNFDGNFIYLILGENDDISNGNYTRADLVYTPIKAGTHTIQISGIKDANPKRVYYGGQGSVTGAPEVDFQYVKLSSANFNPVQDITGVKTQGIAEVPLKLNGAVVPSNATNKTIVWTLQNSGTELKGGEITYYNEGQVKVIATIKDGLAVGKDFTKEFTIQFAPSIKIGMNQKIKQGSELNFNINVVKQFVTAIKVDGKVLAVGDYVFEPIPESIYFNFSINSNYISKLKSGVHTFEMVSKYGSAKTKFTILGSDNSPKTGDNSNVGLAVLMLVIAILGYVTCRKLKKFNTV